MYSRGRNLGLVTAVLLACQGAAPVVGTVGDGGAGDPGAPAVLPATLPSEACRDTPFEDITDRSGITFVQHTTTQNCIHDIMGTGGCLLDYDRDGDLDVYLVDRAPGTNRMYRNDGHGHFDDVTQSLGVGDAGPSMGCLAFDYDGDGDEDLYLTRNDGDRLYRNDGTRFEDVTAASGIVTQGVGSSATAGDIDGDGDLDLFVGRMIDESTCPAGCSNLPQSCQPHANYLWENRGGHFVDVTHARGIDTVTPTLAVRFHDLDRDGHLDLYVGNDLGSEAPFYPDQFYRNDGTGHFTDMARTWGLDRCTNGQSGDTMGVAISDIDLDGAPDLVSSNTNNFSALLYHCDASLHCHEEGHARGLDWSQSSFKWAVDFEDFDRDGWPDLFIANGAIDPPYPQPSQLYWNQQGSFVLSALGTHDPLSESHNHRAALYGDLDGDGLLDVVLTSVGERPRVLRSRQRCGRGLAVALDSLSAGARVRVTANGHTLERQVSTSASYLGSGSPWLYFGLGPAERADVDVRWLDGRTLHRTDVPAEQVLHLARPAPGS